MQLRVEDMEGRLQKLGAGGIEKPKDLLNFVNDLKYKAVGGQQLEGDCIHELDKLGALGAMICCVLEVRVHL